MNKKICGSACSCKAALHHFNIIEEWMAFRFMSSFGRIKVCSDKEHNESRGRRGEDEEVEDEELLSDIIILN